jgi:hypothetical protein
MSDTFSANFQIISRAPLQPLKNIIPGGIFQLSQDAEYGYGGTLSYAVSQRGR